MHIPFVGEEGQLVLVGSRGVGAEGLAVAALVAHIVDMDHLVHIPARYLDGHIGTVRTDIHAALADVVAAQAALVRGAGLRCLRQNALLRINRFIAHLRYIAGADFGIQNGFAGQLRVRNGLHDDGSALGTVADDIDILHRALQSIRRQHRQTLLVHGNAVLLIEAAVYPLADGGNDGIAGDADTFRGLLHRTSAACVHIGERHAMAEETAVLQRNRCQKLREDHAVGNGLLQLLGLGGHVAAGSPVHQIYLFHAGIPHSCPGGIHGRVAAADNRHISAERHLSVTVLEDLQEVVGIHGRTLCELQRRLLMGTHGQNHGIVLCLQCRQIIDPGIQHESRAHGLCQCHVLLDFLCRETEGWDNVGDHTACAGGRIINGYRGTCPGQIEGGGDTGGTCTDNGHFFLAAAGGGERRQNRVIALSCGDQLVAPDLYRTFVLISGAGRLTAVCTDVSGHEGQRVLIQNHAKRFLEAAFIHETPIGGDVLMDGTTVGAGGSEAVHQRHLGRGLPVGQRLHGLTVVVILLRSLGQLLYAADIDPDPRGGGRFAQKLCHLNETGIAAGLQKRGGHGYGPDAGADDVGKVEIICAAGVGNPELAVEGVAQLPGHLHGQGIEGLAGHVHLGGGQLVPCHIHREGIGELHAELQTPGFGQCLQATEHGHRIGKLEVILEVEVREGDVVVAHAVQDAAGLLIAEERGVALHQGMKLLFGDQIGSNGFDFLGRAAVKGRNGDRIHDIRGDGIQVLCMEMCEAGEIALQPAAALLIYGGGVGMGHGLQEAVHLGTLDALEIVAAGNIELEAVGAAQTPFPGNHLQGKPGLDVLVPGLGDLQLCGPLTVVALVLRGDAGLLYTLRQLPAVHLLHGLQLEEAGAAVVGGNDVLRELGVGTGSGTDLCLQLPAEEGIEVGRVRLPAPGHAEAGAGFVLLQQAVHQLPEGNGGHNITHVFSPEFVIV